MYSWNGEDFFENDDNRDITAALIGRFYENIERNHNVQYATTGLLHLIDQTKNEKLLETISLLEPIKFHPKIKIRLAVHPYVTKNVLKRFLKQDDKEIKEAIAYNSNLDKSIVKELIKDKNISKIVAKNIELDDEIFQDLNEYALELAQNESLSLDMQKNLFKLKNYDINLALASNNSLEKELIDELLSLKDKEIEKNIYLNSATDTEILKKAYEDENNYLFLAKNISTPQEILEQLYERGDDKILDALSRNENTPVEILYQLQLDSRFDRAVKTNKAFGKHIQSENIGWLV
jgi:Lhr-like helicase